MECLQIIDIICKTITIAVSLVNLFYVIGIHNEDRKERISAEENRRKENWYNSLKIREIAIEYVDKLDELVNRYYLEEKKKTKKAIVESVNEEFLYYQNKLIRAIICFDKTKEGHFSATLNSIQDDLVIMSNMIEEEYRKEQVLSKKDEIAIKIITLSSEVL